MNATDHGRATRFQPWTCPKCKVTFKGKGAHIKNCGRILLDPAWFWPKVDQSAGEAACWPWQGAISSWGYGTVNFRGHGYGAHKLAWMMANGEVPEGLCVLHRCDNRPCCNPGHLFLGTKKDNGQDAKQKGRVWKGGNKRKFPGRPRYIFTA